MNEIAKDVFAFRLYTVKECRVVLDMIMKNSAAEAPNSMNKYGRILTGKIAGDRVKRIVEDHVAPIAREKYGVRLRKQPYAFLVDYSVGTQRSLAAHVDASDVTLNVCLGREFEGGDLVLMPEGAVEKRIEQSVGWAVVHRGSLEHRAAPLTSGRRSNLILWCTEAGSKPAGESR